MKRNLLGLSIVISLIFANLSPLLAQAAGASISVTLNKSSVSVGSTVVAAVYMNGGGTPINAVEADLSYPASKLQYVGLSYTGSAFTINTPGNGGGSGSVSIQNGTINPVSGGALIATVTFKALAGSGSAAISVAGSSHLISANDNSSVPYTSSGANVSFGAGSSASSDTTTPSSTPAASTPAQPKDTTPPNISAIIVTKVTPFSATITWTTNKPADSAVDYGLDASYGLSDSASGMTTSHSVDLDSSFLVPETSYHFRVRSVDASGNVATSTDQSFSLPGVPVTVVVLGPDGKPQAGAQVTIDNSSATTDANGKAVLASGLGNKKITTTYQGVTVQKPITVGKTTQALPPYQLDLTKQPLNHWMLTSIGLTVVVLTLLGIDAMLFGSRFLARLTGVHFMPEGWHNAHEAVAAAGRPAPAPTSSTPFSMPQPAAAVVAEAKSEPVATEPGPIEQQVANLMEPASEITPVSVPTPLQPSRPQPIAISRFGASVPAASPLSTPSTTTKITVLDDNSAVVQVKARPLKKAAKKKPTHTRSKKSI